MSEDAYPSEDEIAQLTKDVFGGPGGRSSKELAQAVFDNRAVDAAMTITSLALHANNENTRLRAAQYVVDRNMGPMSATLPPGGSVDDELMNAMKTFNNAVRENGAG